MVDRNDGNGYTEVSNNDVFVGTRVVTVKTNGS